MTRLTYITGGHDKFWEISDTVEKAYSTNRPAGFRYEVTVHWGKRGTDGLYQVKTFTSRWRAEEFVRKKIAEKRRKGYQIDPSVTKVPSVERLPPPPLPSIMISSTAYSPLLRAEEPPPPSLPSRKAAPPKRASQPASPSPLPPPRKAPENPWTATMADDAAKRKVDLD